MTEMRAKQNEEYLSFTAETKQAMVAMEKAIIVLIKGATGQPEAAFLQTQGRQAVKSVVESLPGTANLKENQLSFLSEFLNGKTQYTPQSMTVQGILKDMYETFASDVESATSTEADQNTAFETNIANLIETANNLKKEKAKKEVNLADDTQEYDETEAQMQADIAFFDETK